MSLGSLDGFVSLWWLSPFRLNGGGVLVPTCWGDFSGTLLTGGHLRGNVIAILGFGPCSRSPSLFKKSFETQFNQGIKVDRLVDNNRQKILTCLRRVFVGPNKTAGQLKSVIEVKILYITGPIRFRNTLDNTLQ